MAVTKLIPIKVNIKACADYICNPEKTDGEILISSEGCTERSAEAVFEAQLKAGGRTNTKGKENLAFHLIQSFSPDDKVTAQEAHKIGQEFLEKMYGGKYSFVMSTHIDKKHIHNHFLICAAQNDYSGRKFNDNKAAIYNIRRKSDEICEKHSLSIIPKKKKGNWKQYKEWQEDKTNPKGSIRTQLINIINATVKQSDSLEDYIEKMRKQGIEIKEGNSKKYGKILKYKLPDSDKWFRDYNLDKKNNRHGLSSIEKRITDISSYREKKQAEREARKASMTAKEKILDRNTLKSREMHNTNVERTDENRGLLRWQENQNRLLAEKIISDAMEKYNLTLDQFSDRRNELSDIINEHTSDIKKLQEKLSAGRELLSHCETFRKTELFEKHYQTSHDKEAYFESHESKLLAHEEAKNWLELRNINTTEIDKSYTEKLQGYCANIEKQIEDLKKQTADLQKEANQIDKWQHSLDIYWGKEPEQEQKIDLQKTKNHTEELS